MTALPNEEDAPEVELRTRIGGRDAGRRLLDFLSARFRYHPREVWSEHVAAGRVTVGGARVGPEHELRRGDVVAYRKHHVEPEAPTAIAVLHDAHGVLVVDKPAGLPCHGDGAFLARTLVAVLTRRLGARPSIVQRLDRETSGVCALARDRATARALHAQLAAGAMRKTYLALVHGVVAPEHTTLDLPIGHAADSQVSIRRAAGARAAGARPARTDFEMVARGAAHTLLRCRPHTGRTHQIRVHLEALGHPVVGDKLYGRSDEEFIAFVARVKARGGAGGELRQMLHAAALELTVPSTGEPLRCSAPLPADFAAALRERGLACEMA
jgi:RluA family pseudouridine synthase